MAILNIIDFGAAQNEIATKAIQEAIDKCETGDTVVIPSGTYTSGAIFLKGDMTLHFEEGARLVGSTDIKDYPVFVYRFEGLEQQCYSALINTYNGIHSNIAITGKGIIDASGAELRRAELTENAGKPGRAICIRNTDGVKLEGIVVRQSPAWCVHLVYCDNIEINDIEIHSKYNENGERYRGIVNGDGLDIDSCKHVLVKNSLIASQDDCIAIKSGRDKEGRDVGISTEDVTIENCCFYSGFGVVVGSEMSGGVKDVFVRNCEFKDSFSIGSIKPPRGRGSRVENIHYENCKLVNTDETIKDCEWFRGGIMVDTFYSHITFDVNKAEPVDEGTPYVDGIYFKDCELETVGGNAIYLCGLPEMPLGLVHLENIKAKGIKGMYVANTAKLTMKNVEVETF